MPMAVVDRMDQNLLVYMVNLRTKKLWWPLFQLVVEVAVNNAYQRYCQSHLYLGKYRFCFFGFCQAIVDVYYHLCRKRFLSTTLFRGSSSLHHLANNFQLDYINHWIANGSQQRCSIPGCKWTSAYYCKKMQCLFSCWMFWFISP